MTWLGVGGIIGILLGSGVVLLHGAVNWACTKGTTST